MYKSFVKRSRQLFWCYLAGGGMDVEVTKEAVRALMLKYQAQVIEVICAHSWRLFLHGVAQLR